MKVIGFHPDADAEITDAARYYEVRTSALGLTFLTEVERALDQILMNPDASPKIGKRLRRKSLWRFPYNLVYTVYPDRIRILACAHQKRRPFYWRKRLK
jgi:toxin ParE1/3/4